MIFKVSHDKKIHLINLKGKESIEELKKAIAQAFKLVASGFELSYIDEDGDQITLNDEQDFAILTSLSLKTMKINVQEVDTDVKSESELSLLQEKCEPKIEESIQEPVES